jgi:hypothetical protein
MQVLSKVFKGPMVGARPTDKYASRDGFIKAFGILGLPQPPAVLPPTQEKTLKQPVVTSDEALNMEVLHAFYGKYAAKDGLLDFESLYHRVVQNAVRRKHGESRSQAANQKAYQDNLGRSNYAPTAAGTNGSATNGRPFSGGPRARSEHLRSVLFR